MSAVYAVRVSLGGVVIQRNDEQQDADEQSEQNDVLHLSGRADLLSELTLACFQRSTSRLTVARRRLVRLHAQQKMYLSIFFLF